MNEKPTHVRFEDLPQIVLRLAAQVGTLNAKLEELKEAIEAERPEPMLNLKQAAAVIEKSAPTVRKMIDADDTFPVHVMPGTGEKYFFARELARWMKKSNRRRA